MENSDESRADELRRRISALSWDIPNLSNEEVKARRLAEIERYKAELASISAMLND